MGSSRFGPHTPVIKFLVSAEWPTFWKNLLTQLPILSDCILNIYNSSSKLNSFGKELLNRLTICCLCMLTIC